MDLLCTEGECSLIKSEVWEKMAMHEPAGTIEMKPPEVDRYTNFMHAHYTKLDSLL